MPNFNLILIENTDNSDENVMEDAFWINLGQPLLKSDYSKIVKQLQVNQ